ncbi:HAMP domain-containing sensor histidine kinase [Paenibacillus sp. LHD-117]|uniref:sensor histidine kinase n=1 Tax=Paenibacillus sp. LHD-117 TaxID=3071412 RepID=UPI0027DED40A|nr:HAMP domain-containing sensor histidine kinase [Paenibacillus sp. LHD-117]MDQ6422958.1 HAMP domain-containing sensor histidine kinase [Paenibacillus sp. LHD-117]
MILFILAVMTITGIVLVTTSMKSSSAWLTGCFAGSILLIVGFMYYFAKSGGLPYRMEFIFFLHPDIHRYFQYSTITIDEMSRLLSIGRAVFLFFMAGFVIGVSTIIRPRFKKIAYAVSFLFALLSYLIYEPVVYARLTEHLPDIVHSRTAFIMRASYLLYELILLVLLIRELGTMRTPWLRNKFMIVFVTVVNLAVIFLLFGVLSPLQVSHAVSTTYFYMGSLYYHSMLSVIQWYVLIGISFVVTIVGGFSLWRYNKLVGQIGKPELLVEKKIRQSDMGVRVFTHGIKNQILAQRVLIRNLKRRMAEAPEAEDQNAGRTEHSGLIRDDLERLAASNDQILQRMDELYGAFKTNRMRLRPTSVRFIYEHVLPKLDPEQRALLRAKPFKEHLILADLPYIVQTVYNLLSNAFDAVHDNRGLGRAPSVSFDSCLAGHYVVLQIKDNGTGIDKNHRHQIFDPFYTRKNSDTNWGLGLSYVQQTVKAHFGYVRFDSKLGEGTTFYVYLPIYRSDD